MAVNHMENTKTKLQEKTRELLKPFSGEIRRSAFQLLDGSRGMNINELGFRGAEVLETATFEQVGNHLLLGNPNIRLPLYGEHASTLRKLPEVATYLLVSDNSKPRTEQEIMEFNTKEEVGILRLEFHRLAHKIVREMIDKIEKAGNGDDE